MSQFSSARDCAREYLEKALRHLSDALFNDDNGIEDYKDEHVNNLHEAHILLTTAHKLMRPQ